MAEQIINPTEPIEEEDLTKKYLDIIQDMKKNYVPREKLDKVLNENSMLLDTIASGQASNNSSTEEPAKRSIEELANTVSGPGHEKLTDVQFIQDIFELREAILEKYNYDIAVPHGQKYQIDINDEAAAVRVAEGLGECVEVSGGDNKVFAREVERAMNGGSGFRF